MIHKAFKYRIYPNIEQQNKLSQHFGCVRFIYNWGLNKKIEAYQINKKNLSYFDLTAMVTQLKKQEEFSWLKDVNAQSLQASLMCIDKAFNSFFKHSAAFPKFHSKKTNKNSFQCPQGIKILDNKLTIPKMPNIKMANDRSIKGKIKTSTVSKTCTGKYFISILTEQEGDFPKKPEITEQTTIGIDLGIKTFATISDGRKIDNPKFLKKSTDKLAREQQKLSKKKKGSNNRNKQRLKVALIHEKITNQRSDFLHKLTHQLTHENQVDSIAVEDLNIAGMVKNHCLARSISDVAWREWIRQLTYKTDWYGKNLLTIGRFEPSSRLCPCGTINHDLTLSDRIWTCKKCDATHDRDDLASNNIKRFALIGVGNSELTLVESIHKTDSLKQEEPQEL